MVRSSGSSTGLILATALAVALGVSLVSTASAQPRRGPTVEPVAGPHHNLGRVRGHAGDLSRLPSRFPSRPHGVRLFDCDVAGPEGRCGTLRVPLDRAHPARAKLTLFFLYYRHRDPGPSREAIMLSEGGPGFSVTNTQFEAPAYKAAFDPLLNSRDLIMIDQRGVGNSDVINCPALQADPDFGDPSILPKFARCADHLGDRATMYGSGDVALDMEAVRRALGIRVLDLYGGSYAAQDVQSYVLRFSDRVRTAVLDSPVSASVIGQPGQVADDFLTDVAFELPDIVDRLCARSGSCSASHIDTRADLAWLTQRLAASPLFGSANDLLGQTRTVTVTEASLAWTILQAGDFGLTALTEVAAAAAALRDDDDPAPLLRLAAEAATPVPSQPDPAEIFSWGDNAARSCMDLRVPWDTAAPIAQRRVQWDQTFAGLPDAQFGVFSKDGWVSRPPSPVAPDACIVWPGPSKSTPPAIPAGAAFPRRVPALVIAGDLDLSIPSLDSRALHQLWPGTKYVEIANAQHHVFFTAPQCSQPIIVRFLRSGHTGETGCAKRNTDLFSFPGVGRFPLVAADGPAAMPHGQDASTLADRRVAAVATAAVTDAFRRGFGPAPVETGAGLRGGTFTIAFGNRAVVRMSGVRWTNDVAVSGRGTYTFPPQRLDATVRVAGPGHEDGHLRIGGVWFGFGVKTTVLDVRGTLDGRHISVTVPGS
jgi:pimeloyl-ACP methyl ester carboxylesterase